jgi:hypothetical protein
LQYDSAQVACGAVATLKLLFQLIMFCCAARSMRNMQLELSLCVAKKIKPGFARTLDQRS